MKSAKKPANRAFYLIIALVAIGGIAALTYAATRPKTGATTVAFDSTLPKVESHGYVMGSPTAPMEVTEFGDFECPQCGRFATLTEPDVRQRLVLTGRIRWRFIDYPLDMHRNTWNASIAAACADEQDKFWPMHDAIFAAQDQWNSEATSNPNKVLKQIGEQIVPDKAKFDQCIDTQRSKPRVQAHWQLAMSTKAPGTPTFMFGDQQIPRFLTYDEFKQMVDDAIAKGNTKPFIPDPSAPATDAKKPAELKKSGP